VAVVIVAGNLTSLRRIAAWKGGFQKHEAERVRELIFVIDVPSRVGASVPLACLFSKR
jgi:hypothetical protein